ncbi:MAG: zinc-dependent peptidase [Casimicrobiaceae bacterium]|nr:zinc-dependent peptidase [Casimicrobiaceae bacterium]MCX8099447.1 zinc-dependent peptidase [Casimicrobiaceae bacterium]MDW8313114.1 zinc-dependent peptidase [Burkholderiales bacterium]
MFEWLERKRRERALARYALAEEDWQRALAQLPFIAHYETQLLERLRALATLFLVEKSIVSGATEGRYALEVTPFMRVLVAAQACLLILGRGTSVVEAIAEFDGFENVIIHPDDFPRTYDYEDEAGVVHVLDEPIAGESWDGGPVLLSWPAVEAGYEETGMALVIHEFAHKIDLNDGVIDGVPPLRGAARRRYLEVLERAFADFSARVDAGETTAIDPYAAEAIEEFFAVSCEVFFAEPQVLATDYPEFFAELRAWFGLDPIEGRRWPAS